MSLRTICGCLDRTGRKRVSLAVLCCPGRSRVRTRIVSWSALSLRQRARVLERSFRSARLPYGSSGSRLGPGFRLDVIGERPTPPQRFWLICSSIKSALDKTSKLALPRGYGYQLTNLILVCFLDTSSSKYSTLCISSSKQCFETRIVE